MSETKMKMQNMTVYQFMEFMNIGRTEAYKLVNDEKFYPAFRIGKKILINMDKLQKWISEKTGGEST